jgi:hypothetical protein
MINLYSYNHSSSLLTAASGLMLGPACRLTYISCVFALILSM